MANKNNSILRSAAYLALTAMANTMNFCGNACAKVSKAVAGDEWNKVPFHEYIDEHCGHSNDGGRK